MLTMHVISRRIMAARYGAPPRASTVRPVSLIEFSLAVGVTVPVFKNVETGICGLVAEVAISIIS